MGSHLLRQTGEILASVGARQIIKRPSLAQLVENFVAQQAGGAIVKLGEQRRDPGLERKAAQQAGTKAVDGLNPQAARRLDRARKQASGGGQRLVCQGAVNPKFDQLGAQAIVVQHGPTAKALEQAVLHLAGGGLGVGQAQNPPRIDAGQQQPRHPVGQHPGLARTGVGGKPGREARIGRLDLPRGGVIAVHPTSSGCGGSLWSHSP